MIKVKLSDTMSFIFEPYHHDKLLVEGKTPWTDSIDNSALLVCVGVLSEDSLTELRDRV